MLLQVGVAEDFLESLGDKSVYSVITDIPYNEVNRKTGGLRKINKGFADSDPVNLPKLVEHWIRVSQGHIIVWCGTKQISPLIELFEARKLTTRLGSWTKTNPSPMNGKKGFLSGKEFCVIARQKKSYFSGNCVSAEWTGPRSRNIKFLNGEKFPTPKPVWLMREQIETVVPLGEIVLDTHMGSGATGIACGKDYEFWGIDKNPECVALAQHRIKFGK